MTSAVAPPRSKKPNLFPDDVPVLPCTVIAKDGVWCVPPKSRPTGWQSLGLCEPVTLEERARRFVSGKSTQTRGAQCG